MDLVKRWALPLFRTFLAAFLPVLFASVTAVQAGNVNLGNLSWWWSIIGGAVAAGVNAVVLVLQHATPVLPSPTNPSVK